MTFVFHKLAHVLNFFFRNCAITCPDTILVYNTYFDRLHDDVCYMINRISLQKVSETEAEIVLGGNDVPLGSAPGKTDMHGLIMGSSKDICSLFDSYLPNHEASTHEITCRMFSTQLWSSSKKNQIKRSSYMTVMPFTNQEIFNSREFRPPKKLEMANLLSDEPTTNSIMPKIQKQTCLGQTEKPIKYWLRKKMDFDQASKGHVLAHIRSIFFTFQSPGRGYIKRQSKF
uniref:Uncharacterized protein n=1 Tax=Brassica oleracea var. oleracea TaxID=109376 RepID=A0A0D3D4E2_BRAOL